MAKKDPLEWAIEMFTKGTDDKGEIESIRMALMIDIANSLRLISQNLHSMADSADPHRHDDDDRY